MQKSALCRSRRELSSEYLLAKIGVDTDENETLEVWGENSIQYLLHSLGAARPRDPRRGRRGSPGARAAAPAPTPDEEVSIYLSR